MLGHRDQIALHQAAGGFLRIGEPSSIAARSSGSSARSTARRSSSSMSSMIATASSVSSSVASAATWLGLSAREHGVAHPVVHLGEHVAVEQLGERGGQRLAHVPGRQLEQIGDVGGVERAHQRARGLLVARRGRHRRRRDEIMGEDIVLVVAGFGRGRLFGRDDRFFEVGFAHRCRLLTTRLGAS